MPGTAGCCFLKIALSSPKLEANAQERSVVVVKLMEGRKFPEELCELWRTFRRF